MNYTETKSVAESFAKELHNERSPSVCPFCWLAFSLTLSNDPGTQAHLPRLRAEYHVIFDASIRALLLPRTSDDLDKLRAQMKTNLLRCERPVPNHDLQYRISSQPLDHLYAFLEGLSEMIHAGLYQGERSAVGRASIPHKAFGDKQGRWPSRVEQLFPYGATEAVNALLNLCDLQISGSPLGILNELLCVSRSVVFPLLLAERNRMRIVRLVAKQIDPVQLREMAKTAPGLLEGNNGMLTSASGFLHILHVGPNAVPGDAPEFHAGGERILLSAINACLEVVPDDDRALHLLGPIAMDIFSHMGETPDIPISMRIVEWVHGRIAALEPSFARTLSMLVSETMQRRRCSAPGCGLAELDGGGRPFKTCSRCKVPRYCSTDCQARDWKGDAGRGLPHKRLCPVLRKIDAQSCVGKQSADFEAKYNESARTFTREDRLVLNEFATDLCREHGYVLSEDELHTFPSVDAV